jgi:cytochrome d ubiquinol oxidase subunit II
METLWYIFLAVMITMYVILDGFDLGVGALHRVLARNDDERGEATDLIGPVWNGNEVWLIAGGGVLFLAFPLAYAAAFSGLYFGLILVLWLLVGRGLGLELRHQIDDPMWRSACDTVFWLASATLVFVLGVALGNVVRGVPLGPDGYFHLPLFDILNWYAVLVGVLAVAILIVHGTAFLALRATGALAERARRWGPRLWWIEAALIAVMAWPTHAVRSSMLSNFGDHPWRLVFPVLAVGGAARHGRRAARRRVGAGLFGLVAGDRRAAEHRSRRLVPQHPPRPGGPSLRPDRAQCGLGPPRADRRALLVAGRDRAGDRLLRVHLPHVLPPFAAGPARCLKSRRTRRARPAAVAAWGRAAGSRCSRRSSWPRARCTS